MDIEEINTDRDKFLEAVSSNVETELKKIGLRLINVNVTDINDESGYIQALGKEAAAKVINDAKISVAEQTRRQAKGEADAIYAKMQAQAKGMEQILTKQAKGLADIVKAAGGNAEKSAQLMIGDKLEDLVKIQVEAVKNLKIDKATVWDGMNGKDGSSTTSNFLSSMMKSILPMNEMFGMAGMALPEFLGKEKFEINVSPETDISTENTPQA